MNNQMPKQAIVVTGATMNPHHMTQRLALFNENGTPVEELSLVETQTGADVVLTGFTAETAAPVAATDTVNEAIAKLEARIVELETA